MAKQCLLDFQYFDQEGRGVGWQAKVYIVHMTSGMPMKTFDIVTLDLERLQLIEF